MFHPRRTSASLCRSRSAHLQVGHRWWARQRAGPAADGCRPDQGVGVGFGWSSRASWKRSRPDRSVDLPGASQRPQIGADLINLRLRPVCSFFAAAGRAGSIRPSLHREVDVLRFQARVEAGRRPPSAPTRLKARRSGRRPQRGLITPQRPSHGGHWARIEPSRSWGSRARSEADRGIEALDRRMQACSKRSLPAAAAACGSAASAQPASAEEISLFHPTPCGRLGRKLDAITRAEGKPHFVAHFSAPPSRHRSSSLWPAPTKRSRRANRRFKDALGRQDRTGWRLQAWISRSHRSRSPPGRRLH